MAALATKKAKSEAIVYPVLSELKRHNPSKVNHFSGYELNVNKEQGLTGFCDFILSASAYSINLTTPIICLVEAKNDNIERGLAQCGAEMYAAYLFNEQKGSPREIIYGCVTNAFSWCFLKLENKILYIDPNYVPLTFTDPYPVLATLQGILNECLNENP